MTQIDPRDEAILQAISDCSALDENGYICTKSEAMKVVKKVMLSTPPRSHAAGVTEADFMRAMCNIGGRCSCADGNYQWHNSACASVKPHAKAAAVLLASRPAPSEEVIGEIAAERRRQIEVEGWGADHDDDHKDGSIAAAAACYALPSQAVGNRTAAEWPTRGECCVQVPYEKIPLLWPRSWHPKWWKPKERRRNLVIAATLLVAEIERLDRLALLADREIKPE